MAQRVRKYVPNENSPRVSALVASKKEVENHAYLPPKKLPNLPLRSLRLCVRHPPGLTKLQHYPIGETGGIGQEVWLG